VLGRRVSACLCGRAFGPLSGEARGPWPLRASPLASPLGEAGAVADGLERRRRGREARIVHPLQDGAIEGVDGQHEPVRGSHGVARAEDAALFGGLAV